MRRRLNVLLAAALAALAALISPGRAYGGGGVQAPTPPTIDVGVTEPAGEPTSQPGSGTGAGDGGGEPAPLSPEWQAYVDCVNGGGNCLSPGFVPGDDTPSVAPVIDPAALAQSVVDSVPLHLPGPHTSPPEGGFQLTGVETWFWLDPDTWEPVSARAELPGVWAEVTATPVRAAWEPGDGSATVTCDGPGREHPGTERASTDCGHTYVDVGTFTVHVEVTWEVTWRSSTGAAGELDAITVAADLPLEVQQRQAVTD